MEDLRRISKQVLRLYQDIFHTFSLSVLHNLLYVLFLKNKVVKLIYVGTTFCPLSNWLVLHKF